VFDSQESLQAYIRNNSFILFLTVKDSPSVTAIPALPAFPRDLCRLELSCRNLAYLPALPCKLAVLRFCHSPGLPTLPALPAELQTLHIVNRPDLVILPELPAGLKLLEVYGCGRFAAVERFCTYCIAGD
jgi:hypothetical protein